MYSKEHRGSKGSAFSHRNRVKKISVLVEMKVTLNALFMNGTKNLGDASVVVHVRLVFLRIGKVEMRLLLENSIKPEECCAHNLRSTSFENIPSLSKMKLLTEMRAHSKRCLIMAEK